MAPDLNSLPPSRSSSQTQRNIHRTHPPNLPLAQPIAGSAGTSSPAHPSPDAARNLQLGNSPMMSGSSAHSPSSHSPRHRSSPRVERRRSSLLVGEWSLNEGTPTTPGTADPYHQRTHSLGELHQELENEQEAQVNRLLALIRQQQAQLAHYQAMTGANSQPSSAPASAAVTDSSQLPTTSLTQQISPPAAPSGMTQQRTQPVQPSRHRSGSQRSNSTTPSGSLPESLALSSQPPLPATSQQQPSMVGIAQNYRSEFSPSARRRRSSSRRSSHQPSPALVSSSYHSGGSWPADGGGADSGAGGGARDEVSLMQAEAAMVQRENQMLKVRIRELERIVRDMGAGEGARTTVSNEADTRDGEDGERGRRAAAHGVAAVADVDVTSAR